ERSRISAGNEMGWLSPEIWQEAVASEGKRTVERRSASGESGSLEAARDAGWPDIIPRLYPPMNNDQDGCKKACNSSSCSFRTNSQPTSQRPSAFWVAWTTWTKNSIG